MAGKFHPGETAVQQRAGVEHLAARLAKSVFDSLPGVGRAFVACQPMAVAASRDAGGAVWASLLTGPVGFLAPLDAHNLQVTSRPAPGDPLADSLRPGSDLGLLVIDLATRRRVRLNGVISLEPEGFSLHIHEAFSNCPRYIQARLPVDGPQAAPISAAVLRSPTLTEAQRDWIRAADTFFIASRHPEAGADASHRGGNPGFVHVRGHTLLWPDYAGNNMFQTLGNLHEHPEAGLLFVDFESGSTLQLSGWARILWEPGRIAEFPGAERLLEFAVVRVVEIRGAHALHLRLVERSPYNP